jgi:hypothetical protein
VPLSRIQTDILRLLAAHRDPEAYVAVAWHGRFASIEINPLLVRPRGAGVAGLAPPIVTPADRRAPAVQSGVPP